MKNLKFLTGVIFLISVFLLLGLAGKAHAFFGWYGFSELCYYAELKGSPDQEIVINIVNLRIQAGCYNEQNDTNYCMDGEGNSGSFTIDAFPTTNSDSDKVKNVVKINGCIDLDKYTTHYQEGSVNPMEICKDPFDTDCHVHICKSSDPNKVEIVDSAYVSSIDVYYDVINTKNNKKLYSAHQICTYPGTIGPDCLPVHDGDGPNGSHYFDCLEEQIIN